MDPAGRRRWVAASVGPFGATLHDGSEYHGRYPVDWRHVRRFHRDRLSLLADSGPDLLAVETIPSLAEAEIVLEEAERVSDLPLWLSMSCADSAHTCHGEPLVDVARRLVTGDRVVAFGVNCTAPEFVHGLLTSVQQVVAPTDTRLLAYPNHGGRWDGEHWHGTTELDIEARVVTWVRAGATLVGGCCGVGPAAIARVRDALAAYPPTPRG